MRKKRRKNPIIGIAVIVLVLLLVAGGVLAATYVIHYKGRSPSQSRDLEAEIRANRAKEIFGLEKMRDEDVEQARKDGKSQAEIEFMKGKYQSEIDRLKSLDLPPKPES